MRFVAYVTTPRSLLVSGTCGNRNVVYGMTTPNQCTCIYFYKHFFFICTGHVLQCLYACAIIACREKYIEDGEWVSFCNSDLDPKPTEAVYARHAASNMWCRAKVVANDDTTVRIQLCFLTIN